MGTTQGPRGSLKTAHIPSRHQPPEASRPTSTTLDFSHDRQPTYRDPPTELQRKRRQSRSCDQCRHMRKACDADPDIRVSREKSCSNCARRGRQCTFVWRESQHSRSRSGLSGANRRGSSSVQQSRCDTFPQRDLPPPPCRPGTFPNALGNAIPEGAQIDGPQLPAIIRPINDLIPGLPAQLLNDSELLSKECEPINYLDSYASPTSHASAHDNSWSRDTLLDTITPPSWTHDALLPTRVPGHDNTPGATDLLSAGSPLEDTGPLRLSAVGPGTRHDDAVLEEWLNESSPSNMLVLEEPQVVMAYETGVMENFAVLYRC